MLEKYYESYECVGVMQPRCYYIPFGSKAEWNKDRGESSRFTSLSGKWTIARYDRISDVPDDFYKESPQKEIDVPSCVQYYGLDYFQYTNYNYPIPFDPPFVPTNTPAFHYSRKFSLGRSGRQYLVFEGVDSCFYLYVNGKFVGFSQISHRVSEFDVTDFVRDGENKIDVLVLKWCAGTYFEDQDKWRFTGIFREVYLLSRPEKHVVDYKIETRTNGEVSFMLAEGTTACVTLCGETKKVKEGEKVVFSIDKPILWSAETPYLYDLDIESEGEFIRERIGIREVSIENGVFLLNGKGIKLRGVNRHDFNPTKGAAVSLSDVVTDLKLMKELNVNAIRTSHYPSCPEFYALCDEYGFYVIDEADLESHGASETLAGRAEGYLSDLPEFEFAMTERQKMLVTRDKNRPCVIIWSMGNECGWGRNFYACADYIRKTDGTRPVHYERVCVAGYDPKTGERKPAFEDYATAPVDMVSRMYASPEFMRDEFLNDKDEKRPFVQCEYSHAMGNGPGDLKDYWDVIYSSDRFMGGFIWEWADHGVKYDSKGFRYGGDFGETLHDGNFCIDGIIAADRKIKTGTLEMKKAYEPVKIEKEGDLVVITSRNYFSALVFTAEIIEKDGRNVIDTRKTDVALAPGESVSIGIGTEGASTVKVNLYTAEDEGLVAAGHLFASESFELRKPSLPSVKRASCGIEERGNRYVVTCGRIVYEIDRGTGVIASVACENEKVSDGTLSLNVFRAPVDNDPLWRWRNQRLNYAYQDAYSVEKDGENAIVVNGKIVSERVCPIVKFKLRYEFFESGVEISLDYEYKEREEGDFLPRIGLVVPLDKSYESIEFYGFGPRESYIDKRFACSRDYYETTVSKNFEHYVKPQENGSHYGTTYAKVDGASTSVTIASERGVAFNVSPYDASTLSKCAHDDELPESERNYLYVDFYMSGVGSAACGPNLGKEYRVPGKGDGKVLLLFDKKSK